MIVHGFYGVSELTACLIFVYGDAYCIEGSKNVCYTRQPVMDGTHVEQLSDYDSFQHANPINTIEELREACDA